MFYLKHEASAKLENDSEGQQVDCKAWKKWGKNHVEFWNIFSDSFILD